MGLLSVIILMDCSDRTLNCAAYLAKRECRDSRGEVWGRTERKSVVKCRAWRKLLKNESKKTKAGDRLSGAADIPVTFGVWVTFRVTYEQVEPRHVTASMRFDKCSGCHTINSCASSTYTTKWSSLSVGLIYINTFFSWSPASTLIYSNENCKTP